MKPRFYERVSTPADHYRGKEEQRQRFSSISPKKRQYCPINRLLRPTDETNRQFQQMKKWWFRLWVTCNGNVSLVPPNQRETALRRINSPPDVRNDVPYWSHVSDAWPIRTGTIDLCLVQYFNCLLISVSGRYLKTTSTKLFSVLV